MPTPMLFKYATRAEVDRGCIISHDFKDGALATAKNGFSVVGAVPITRGEGAEFPGTVGNYITLPVGGRLNKTELSFVIEFWPNFAANDGAYHYFLDATVASRIICYKTNTNGFVVVIDATTVFNVVLANFADYWYQNKRNVIVVTSTTGANYLYLNGHQVGTSAVAWTATNPDTLYWGSRFSNTDPFNGRMGFIKVFNSILTADEAKKYYVGSHLY